FHCLGPLPPLPSFPTRRSSDLIFTASRFARAALGFIRAVPDILWAILFVTMVGLGPLAGTLALAVAYSGLIGQVYSDVFDASDIDRKSTRLNSSHVAISYAVFC